MKNLISKITSLILWEIGAFKVSLDKPFKLVSGNYSPIYVNCRALISNASVMDIITAFLHWLCVSEKIEVDIVAGGETAGIPFASYVAQRLAKPMVYVRKKTKKHGIQSLVEGSVRPGMIALLVEDLITDGKSKISFAHSLKDVGCQIRDCVVVFDRKQGGQKLLAAEGIKLWALADLDATLAVGRETSSLTSKQEDEVTQYLNNPRAWHQKRGLRFT